MSVETAIIVALVGALASFFGLAWMRLISFSVTTALDGVKAKQTELEVKETKCETILERLSERLRLDELKTTELSGEHKGLVKDVEALQMNHVPRVEWERQMKHLFDQLEEIKRELRGRPGSPSPGRYTGETPPPFASPTSTKR